MTLCRRDQRAAQRSRHCPAASAIRKRSSRNIAVRGAGVRDPLPGDLAVRYIEIVDLRGAGRFWYFNPTRVARPPCCAISKRCSPISLLIAKAGQPSPFGACLNDFNSPGRC